MAKKIGCKKGEIKIEKKCYSMSKNIKSLDEDVVHALFRKHQKRYGVKHGDVNFDFIMPLEAKIQREKGIPLGTLDNKVSKYYEVTYGKKYR